MAHGNSDDNLGGKWERWLGRKKLVTVLDDRKSVLEVSSKDNLCCDQAIWLTKSACDANPADQEAKRYFRNIHQPTETLTRYAKYLHREANVPEGPCGKTELVVFQAYLAPKYQIKVITACYPYGVLFEGQVTEPPLHIVRLLYIPPVGNSDMGRYHGCTSFQAFLGKSYFCDMCNRGYDHEDFRNQPCDGRRCKSCKQVACGAKSHQPTVYCMHCHRHFYNDRCVAFHHAQGICKRWIRCPDCCKEYTSSDDPHQCYTGRCRACREEVDLATHKCYIQSVDEEDLPVKKPASLFKKKQKKKNPHVSPYVEPPIFVYADFKSIIQPDGTHTPILVRAETGDSDERHTFYGPQCTAEFLDFLDSLIYGTAAQPIPKEDSRDVICIFHNLKGYDSVFLQAQLLQEHRKFDFTIPNSTKQLSLSYVREYNLKIPSASSHRRWHNFLVRLE